MRYSLVLPAAVLAGALALGCVDKETPTDPAATAPSFRTEQNPEGAGAVVIHDEQGAIIFGYPDPAPGVTVLVGWTLAEAEHFCATGEVTIGALTELLVNRPDGSLHQILHGAQIPLLIWEPAIPFIDPIAEFCGLLALPHLTGAAQVTTSDNDVFVSGNRADAAHSLVRGQATSETGERFRFSGSFHAVILRNGEQRVTLEFKLTPIGK